MRVSQHIVRETNHPAGHLFELLQPGKDISVTAVYSSCFVKVHVPVSYVIPDSMAVLTVFLSKNVMIFLFFLKMSVGPIDQMCARPFLCLILLFRGVINLT